MTVEICTSRLVTICSPTCPTVWVTSVAARADDAANGKINERRKTRNLILRSSRTFADFSTTTSLFREARDKKEKAFHFWKAFSPRRPTFKIKLEIHTTSKSRYVVGHALDTTVIADEAVAVVSVNAVRHVPQVTEIQTN